MVGDGSSRCGSGGGAGVVALGRGRQWVAGCWRRRQQRWIIATVSGSAYPVHQAAGRGPGWRVRWAWVVVVWTVMVPLSLLLAQSYLLAPLPGQRAALWGGYPSAALTVVAAALFVLGAPGGVQAQVSGARRLRGEVGLLERGRRRALARRVRRVEAVDRRGHEAAALIATCMVVVGGEAVIGAGIAVMALGMAVHAVVAWQVVALAGAGVAGLVAALVRHRDGRSAARWLAQDQGSAAVGW